MASWNIPALINKISEDVPAIKALLTALFKWTDAGTEDVPEGAKRLQSVTGGRQIQEYSGSSWGSVGKLMHDVDMLDGKHASTAQTPDTIPVRDANGSIPGNVTGNAATATTASSVSSECVVPIANGGTGATSAAGARTNLGTNNAENITQGVLATARGGTGRNDGKVTDVFLEDYQTGAVGLGQLGQSVLKNAVNCDTLTKQGRFLCDNCTVALHYPTSGTYIVDVTNCGGAVVQKAFTIDGLQTFVRSSVDTGASWAGWTPDDTTTGGTFHIYVSKGGSNANSGLTADSPVLTLGRAIAIAKGVKADAGIVFHVGPGEWGDLWIRNGYVQAQYIKITNYTDSNVATVAAFNNLTDSGNTGNQPPHFTKIEAICPGYFILGNIHVDRIVCHGCLFNTNAIAFASAEFKNCWIALGAHKVVKIDGVTYDVIYLEHSFLYMGNIASTFVNSPTNSAYISTSTGAELYIENGASWSGTFAGKKFAFYSTPAAVAGKSPTDYPGALAGEGPYFYNGHLFTNGHINIVQQNPHIFFRNSLITKGTAPSVNHYDFAVLLAGASDSFTYPNLFWGLYHTYYTNKQNYISLLVYKGTDDSNTFDTLGIGYDSNGTVYTQAPKPVLDSNNANIATTNWVRTATGNTSLNAATATKLQTARSIALTGAVTGSANFDGSGNIAINSLWRVALVGQSGPSGTNPWYKVAQVVCNSDYGDYEITFLVENTFALHNFGILRVHVRTETNQQINTGSSSIQWLANFGLNPAHFVLAMPSGSSQTAVLWTCVDSGYVGRRFTVLSEGVRFDTYMQWTLFNTSLTDGQSASITTSGTQKASVDVSGTPVGTVIYFAGTAAPAGYLVCNGQAVGRTDFSILFAVIGTRYGAGNGSTTFNVPNLIDRFAQGSATPGTVKAAGLPNITGNTNHNLFGVEAFSGYETNGCITTDTISETKGIQNGSNYYMRRVNIGVNASLSSSIYGNSSTVQPPALTLLPIIKYM